MAFQGPYGLRIAGAKKQFRYNLSPGIPPSFNSNLFVASRVARKRTRYSPAAAPETAASQDLTEMILALEWLGTPIADIAAFISVNHQGVRRRIKDADAQTRLNAAKRWLFPDAPETVAPLSMAADPDFDVLGGMHLLTNKKALLRRTKPGSSRFEVYFDPNSPVPSEMSYPFSSFLDWVSPFAESDLGDDNPISVYGYMIDHYLGLPLEFLAPCDGAV